MNPTRLIDRYKLERNPHGGWYRQYHVAAHEVAGRPAATVIYYLLTAEDVVCTPHRTSAVCIHYYHAGAPLEVLAIDSDDKIERNVIGPAPGREQSLQVVVPGNSWKGFRLIEGDYSLISEAVVPGYLAEDDVVAEAGTFERRFPSEWPWLKCYFGTGP